MNKQYIFYHNPARCIKCYACEVSCKQWHGIKAGTMRFRRVEETSSGTFPDVTRTFKSIACLHCIKPRCIEACPEGAISKRPEDGIVVVDRSKCSGCRACFEACMVKAPQFDEDGAMQKCDMCLERVENGQQPICVANCPTQALHWGTLEELAPLMAKKKLKQ
jgi:DMSO reductase iron-sulfur subunit